MPTHELDPDVVRWGLHLIDACSPMNGGSPKTITCYDKDMSRIEYVEEGYCDTTDSIVKSDEVIAHALQEELSRLETAEASGSTCVEEQDQQASILAQDWFGSSRNHFDSDDKCNQEEAWGEGMVPDNPGDLLAMGEEQRVLLMIADEFTLDGELGRRLNEMVPVPHVPKINGEIPSADDAMSDHERLLARLELYDLVELKISGDGNCQFRSLSDQIYRTPNHHESVREQVVNQLKSNRQLYENYVPMAYDDYLKKMSKTGEWGDHVTLQAAADTYGVKIFVITSFKDTCYIEILPQTLKSNRMIFLSFWAEVHYNSIYPQEEFPVVESKKKKWWKP